MKMNWPLSVASLCGVAAAPAGPCSADRGNKAAPPLLYAVLPPPLDSVWAVAEHSHGLPR